MEMGTMEWSAICRICLQEGEMRSIFDNDSDNILISDKIMRCSNVQIKKGENLPENICLKCCKDLQSAFRFCTNCENSESFLRSFTKNENNYDVNLNKSEYIAIINSSEDTYKRLNTTKNHNDYERSVFIEEQEEFEIKCEPTEETSSEDNDNDPFDVDPVSEKETKATVKKAGKNGIDTKKAPRKKERVRKLKEIKQHICEICGNIYNQKYKLETHMLRHRNIKPFACELCDKTFVLSIELKSHMRTHTGQKPYGCRYCDRHFSDFGSRTKHERTHTGERPYVCETCSRAFMYSYALKSHMLLHTGEKPFQCTKCEKRFTKKHHLKCHEGAHAKHEMRMKLKEEKLKNLQQNSLNIQK